MSDRVLDTTEMTVLLNCQTFVDQFPRSCRLSPDQRLGCPLSNSTEASPTPSMHICLAFSHLCQTCNWVIMKK